MSSCIPSFHHAKRAYILSWTMMVFGGVHSECAGVGEGCKLAEECHVQLHSREFIAFSPRTLQKRTAAATSS